MSESTTRTVVPDTAVTPATRRSARHAERGRRRTGLRAALAVVPLAILASGALVYQASSAAFTASTSTGANSWTAGTVALTNDSSGALLFNVSGIKPGPATTSTTKCVNVSYTGSLTADVKMYIGTAPSSTPGTGGGNLGNLLRVSVEEGTSSTDAACTGFQSLNSAKWLNTNGAKGETLNDFQSGNDTFAANTNKYESGAAVWSAPAGTAQAPQVRSFRIIYWLPDTDDPDYPSSQTPLNNVMGSKVTATLTWEARNN